MGPGILQDTSVVHQSCNTSLGGQPGGPLVADFYFIPRLDLLLALSPENRAAATARLQTWLEINIINGRHECILGSGRGV